MKGIISGIKRMEIHDGDGLRTTVFFKGCPLRCIWCHNPESISYDRQIAFFADKCMGCGICKGEKNSKNAFFCPTGAMIEYGREYELIELCDEIFKDKPFFADGGGITLSGGECLSQAEFAIELAKKCRESGIGVYVDTCGYVSREVFEKIIPYTDKFLYDIKAISPDVHKKCTSRDNAVILDNLKYLVSRKCKIEIRYPLVVGYNDDESHAIGEYLNSLGKIERVKVLQYHNLASSRYIALGMEDTMPRTSTTFDDVEKAVDILKQYGLNAVNGITNT